MRNRTTTLNIKPVYSYKEEDWQRCTFCKAKLFKVIERTASIIEIKCKCGRIENITI